MKEQGYWSADVHIHANYTAPHHQVIEPRDVRLQIAAEDLNYGNMMVANSSGAFIHDRQYFEGAPHRLSGPDYLIYWNEENRSSAYGHMCFLGPEAAGGAVLQRFPQHGLSGKTTRLITRWRSRSMTRVAPSVMRIPAWWPPSNRPALRNCRWTWRSASIPRWMC